MKPSAPVSLSRTNSPERVTPEMRAENSAPTRSARKAAISRSAVSRSAAMARRSASEIACAMSLQLPRLVVGDAAGPKLQRAHQRAMHQQVGIAADRRGEMRIALQVEAEVADVLGRVHGLRLRPQHHLVDEIGRRHRLGARSTRLKCPARSAWTAGRLQLQAFEEIAQRRQLLLARAVVHAIDDGARFSSSVSAAATLAWIMNSSIRRWASSRSGVTMRSTRPVLSSRILRSGRSRSSGSRRSRAAASAA